MVKSRTTGSVGQRRRSVPWVDSTGAAGAMVRRVPGNERSRRSPGGFGRIGRGAGASPAPGAVGQWAQDRAVPASSAVRKLEPQPQAATAFGLLTVKPAPMSVST